MFRWAHINSTGSTGSPAGAFPEFEQIVAQIKVTQGQPYREVDDIIKGLGLVKKALHERMSHDPDLGQVDHQPEIAQAQWCFTRQKDRLLLFIGPAISLRKLS